jgi:hypothetical protein
MMHGLISARRNAGHENTRGVEMTSRMNVFYNSGSRSKPSDAWSIAAQFSGWHEKGKGDGKT